MRIAPSLVSAGAALALASAAACSRSSPPAGAGAKPPRTEFLLVAGDSTYWVTTGGDRTRVRGAPLTLARFGGRFYEVYVGDDDRSYYDAVFVGQRIFRRDLVSGDSAQVYADSAVVVAARRYGAAHPGEAPLRETDEGSERPEVALSSEVAIVASHGAYLTYDVHSSREVRGALENSAIRRAVIDLRTGRRLRVADLVGAQQAAAVLAEGRRRFAAALDSARAARDDRARRALAQFVFEPSSFGLDDVERAPAVVFLAPGQGRDAGGFALPLAPIVVEPAPDWWAPLSPTLPVSLTERAADGVLWSRPAGDVEARYDSASAGYTLLLRAPHAAGERGEWTLGRVQGPVRQLYWLDEPPLDSTTRRALARAFDESALYSDEARTVSWRGRSGARGAGRGVRRIAAKPSGQFTRPAPRTPRPGGAAILTSSLAPRS